MGNTQIIAERIKTLAKAKKRSVRNLLEACGLGEKYSKQIIRWL